ncbi:MAG: bifunctional oligoribonuclease/PAP phosphatase NrnA [Planctomycetales bacterium]|nr:bifunctional oligoribonuclease/PAP phosphatase NrnA [Planctomycetales bacterium]
MSIDWSRFKSIVQEHDEFLLTSHIRPDCDALGSELGMAGVLTALGKRVRIVNADATPPNLAFIDPDGRLELLGRDVSVEELIDAPVMIVLDTSAWAQLGAMGEVLRGARGLKLVMDHHVSEDDLGAELFKNTKAEATGRIVVDAAEELGVALSPEIAKPLLAAVATDTGWFRFNSTTGYTMRVAGKLIDAGAGPAELYKMLYERETIGRLRLVGHVLAAARTELDGRLIHTRILLSDFDESGAVPSDTEDLVNMLLSVAGTEVAFILVAQATGGFKISFRSRCATDCSKLAETFGGGGHKAASGALIDGPLEPAQAKVLDAVRKAMG